jgi:arginyl-tRNA synthetase
MSEMSVTMGTDRPTLTPRGQVETEVCAALVATLGDEFSEADPLVRPAKDEAYDYQSNACLSLAKRVGRPPRPLADAVAQRLRGSTAFAHVEVSGAGFINLRLSEHALAAAVGAALADPRLGVAAATAPQTVVIDYSSPNVAKEMHVGHLRSTVIGDALARVLEFQGHTVVRQNHLGDWGTQFGMLVEQMVQTGETEPGDFARLTELYREAQARDRNDPHFAELARTRVVALQAGDPVTIELWQRLVALSLTHMNEVYARLGVTLVDAHVKGESFYNDRLADTVAELLARGVAQESDGAVVFFSAQQRNRDGDPVALVLRKTDGGFGYGATDAAAIRHRIQDLGGDRLVYVVDARQIQHFSLVFELAAAAGWLDDSVAAEHVSFGTVLGADGRPFKTRSGETVPLSDLLEEAIARARALIDEKGAEMTAAEKDRVAVAVGIGAVKYADLATSRQRDYVFSFERMVSFDGNTGPYLQYALVRAGSVVARAGGATNTAPTLELAHPAERALVLAALAFADAVDETAATLEPHRLCGFLYQLADAYSSFYDACPVLRAPTPGLRASRVALCELAARTLREGLGLLGMTAVEVM